jgi:hypothetical protein
MFDMNRVGILVGVTIGGASVTGGKNCGAKNEAPK